MKVSGNDLFVTAMKKEGVDTIFAYPGGMVVNLLDALHDCHGARVCISRYSRSSAVKLIILDFLPISTTPPSVDICIVP